MIAADRHTKPCISYIGGGEKPTCIWLKDGTKVLIKRVANIAWLEVENQAEITLLSTQGPEMQDLMVDLSRRFLNLIDHPEPGCATWHESVQNIVNQIADVSAKLKRK